MKLFFPSPKSLVKGLKIIFFHPMLYGAILCHWAVFQLPLLPEKAQDPEPLELLEESVPIAQSNTLNRLSTQPKPKPKSTPDKAAQPEVLSKPKPKPLAQALAKNNPSPTPDPTFEKKEEQKPKLEESSEPEDEKKVEQPEETQKSEIPQELEDNQESEDSQESDSSDPIEDGDEENVSSGLQAFTSQNQDVFGGSSAEQAVGFNPRKLPNPELLFTTDSLEAHASGEGELITLDGVESVSNWPNLPFRKARENLEKQYPSWDVSEVGNYAGGPVLELAQADQTAYVSLIKPNGRTSSNTIFVIWKRNPTG